MIFLNILNQILENYGDSCQLCSPLSKKQYSTAKKFIPTELLEILKISNGINEVMINPNNNKIEVIGRIIYSLSEMKSQTASYLSEYGGFGVVFADNGAGGFFILKPDRKIYIYEYYDLGEEYYADSLYNYFGIDII